MRILVLRSLRTVACHLLIGLGFLAGSISALGQETSLLPDAPPPAQPQSPQSNPEQNGSQDKPSKNHIFWVIPNYRSDENPATIKPLTARAKMKVAFDDSFDPSAFLVAGVLRSISTLPLDKARKGLANTMEEHSPIKQSGTL